MTENTQNGTNPLLYKLTCRLQEQRPRSGVTCLEDILWLKPVTRKLVNIISSWICLHKEVQLRKSLDKAESIDSHSGEHLVSRQGDTGHSQISKSDTSQLIDLHSPLQIQWAKVGLNSNIYW